MPKFTRRIKSNKKNITYKKGGAVSVADTKGVGPDDTIVANTKSVGDVVKGAIGDAALGVTDIGLGALGLERKTNNTENPENNGIIKQASEGITAKLDEINTAFDNPEIKKELIESIQNASEIGSVLVEAAQEPLEKFADIGVGIIKKALPEVSSSVVDAGAHAIAALPGAGALISIPKAIDDAAKAAQTISEASSEVADALADGIKETEKEFERLKEEAQKISNRTNVSIDKFVNPKLGTSPKPIQAAGRRKTKNRLFNRKAKTKRVRFAS